MFFQHPPFLYSIFSISVLEVHLWYYNKPKKALADTKNQCTARMTADWFIACRTIGPGTIVLYRLKNGTKEVLKGDETSSSLFNGMQEKLSLYHLKEATKKDEGTYICTLETPAYGGFSRMMHFQLEGKE